tara:strand:+ start:148 stop:1041 length:894 start_codon:yes stop_codon:yes gene_type:complete
MESITLEKLAKLLGGTPLGSFDLDLFHLQDSKVCDERSVCYLKDKKFIDTLSNKAGAVITSRELADQINNKNLIIVEDPYLGYANASKVFFEKYKNENESKESIFGENVIIGKNSVVNSNCVIGNNVIIYDNVSIYSRTKIGDNCIIHSGTVIGSDGFGYASSNDGWNKIEHLGGVEIGTNVEIGAKSAVDRGALGNTVIEDGVKIDNQVHVAHNSFIGENTAIAGQSGMAGSVKIGKNCQIAGQVGIVGHIEIVDNVIVMAKTLVTKSLKEPGVYSGVMPIQKHKDSLKFIAKIKK